MNNFDIAPPAKTVDSLNAVPIDISHINATIVFDASTEMANVDVSVDLIIEYGAG